MLHASRQWLGEVSQSQSSAMESRVLPQTPFSAMYVGNATMRDYESEEVDDQMDEDTPPHEMLGSGVHYSEEECVHYTRGLERSLASLPQVFMENCRQTEAHMGTLDGRVDALHATMQHSISMCSENGQRVQQIQQECETIREDFKTSQQRLLSLLIR